MFANHEFRRGGEGEAVMAGRFSSKALLAELDRVSVAVPAGSTDLSWSAARTVGEPGAGLGAGESWAELWSDLRRDAVFFATLSRWFYQLDQPSTYLQCARAPALPFPVPRHAQEPLRRVYLGGCSQTFWIAVGYPANIQALSGLHLAQVAMWIADGREDIGW